MLLDFLLQSERPDMLQELSLAKNDLTDLSGEKVAAFLEYPGTTLKIFNMHWNKVKSRGGMLIAEALRKNDHLKILDLSWN